MSPAPGRGGGKERRRFPRIDQPFEARYRVLGDPDGAAWRAVTAVNLSASGIRFRGEESIDEGTTLDLDIHVPTFPQPLVLRGIVVWSAMQASGVVETGVDFMDLGTMQQAQVDQFVQFLRRQ